MASRTEAFTVARPFAPVLHGAHSDTITGPGLPRAPLWMCAATALPLKRLNVSCHTRTAEEPCLSIVTLKAPRARRTLPFGFGRSWDARSDVFRVAVGDTCPRISPAGFVFVCTFT